MDFVSRASRFCELVRPVGIAQPIDSWSNGFFVIVTILIVWDISKRKLTSPFAAKWGYLYAVIVALIGLTSFWNHATLSHAGGTADVESMFLLASFLILYGLSRLTSFKSAWQIALLVLANIPLTYIASLPGPITDYTFAFLILAVIGLELIIYISHRYSIKIAHFGWALLSLLAGYLIWQLDVRGIWCNPTSFWQGHAFWHLLTAVAAGLFYLNLASERPKIAEVVGGL